MLKHLLEDLIKIDSSTKEGANKAIDFCKVWLKERHLPAQALENNGYKMLVCEIGQGDRTLVLNGHVDVVSGKAEQFSPKESGGRLYGRGAADMKAGVAAMMCAVNDLKNQKLSSKIQLQIVSDEETGGFHCSKTLADQGYRGDFVICPEPTQLGIGLQAKGILRFELDSTGKSAHGSRPWEGINAIEKTYKNYQKILSLPFMKEQSELYPSPSLNLAKIQGGDVYNKVPEQCRASFEIRFLPTQTKEDILEQIKSVIDGTITVGLTGEPVRTDIDHPYIKHLFQTITQTLGNETLIFGQHGSADTRFFSAYGIPAIEFGPSGANWHGDDEYIELTSVELYEKIIISFALHFHSIIKQSTELYSS